MHILVPPGSVLPPVNVFSDRLLMQIYVEVFVLPFVDVVSVILCVVCLVPAYLSCSSCFGVSFGSCGVSSICCCVLFCFYSYFCWRAADVISCGGACSASSGSCFCNSSVACRRSYAFKLYWVSIPTLGLVRAVV